MDKMIFMAAQASKAAMARQENVASNLANASTPGFRSQMMAFRTAPMDGDSGNRLRVFGVESSVGYDFEPGPNNPTGRPLDVAIQGKGFFTVETPDGQQAYTRNGSFLVNAQGVLVNQAGLSILDTNDQPIEIPPELNPHFAEDGAVVLKDPRGVLAPQTLTQLKLVNPDERQLVRGDDGLFRLKTRQDAQVDEGVRVLGSTLEGSNANPVELMVQMIEAQRNFDSQVRLLSTSEANAKSINSLLSLT